jgi:PAS domain S-box-containing protein
MKAFKNNMGTKLEGQRQKYKILIMAILLAGACFLTYYFHAILETGVVFTHFFYIPIILACIWWRRKGLAVAIFLAVLLSLSNTFIRIAPVTANDYIRTLMFIAIAFVVSILSERIAKAQEKSTHLNAILDAIRKVNQLIIKEKDLDRLLQGVCDTLIQTRGYYNPWIVMIDESHNVLTAAESGLGEAFLPVLEMFERSGLMDCGLRALKQLDVVAVEDPSSTCAGCPLSGKYNGRGAMTVRLEHGKTVYGLLTVSIPTALVTDEEERTLLKDVADDIALALHSIELEDESEHAEEDLKESEERFREFLDNLGDIAYEADRKGNITYANKMAEQVTGLSVDEIVGKPFLSLFTEESQKVAIDMYQRILGGEIQEHELTLNNGKICQCKNKLLIDKDGKIAGFTGIARDITERKRVEEALWKSEERYRTLFEGSRDAIYITTLDGKYLDFNQSMLDLFGYSREEMMRIEVLQTYAHPVDRERFQKEVEQNGFVRDFEVKLRKKDGTEVECLLTSAVRRMDDGSIIGYQGIIRDITERKRAEEEKKKMEAQLQQAQKMEAIGTLAGGVAHDFNNILSLIIGYTELTMMNLPEGSPARDNMDKLLIAGERARNLVKQILTFSRQSEEEKKPLQIHLILKETLKLLRPSLPTTIEISQNITSTPTVLADATQIHQVIMNLCANAYHAMHEKGGMLEVSLADVELESDFTARHPGTYPGPYMRLTVSDTGHGMEKNVLDRIFEPYFTTKEKGEGTGMGLAVVHGIVKSFGGGITVYSESGKGATFKVFLPRIKVAEVEEKPEEITSLLMGNERILFVDDEPAIVDIGKRMLERLGYTVEVRTSPIESLEAFKAQPEKFDLVITDMTMPKMTGDELAKELMAIRPNIPIILCTGFSERITEERAEEMGIRAFSMKPFVMRDFSSAIRKVLNQEKEK